MVQRMDAEGFGSCTNHGSCEAACPKGVSLDFIARLNRDVIRATFGKGMEAESAAGGAG
jgi:succinate dehydrogenase / fumarate reductase iron-sulfur subunit